jgi:tRNA(fMet)-specific endonuclease VapC
LTSFCADTDLLIDISNRDGKALQKLEEIRSKGETVHTTTINMAEFYSGAYRATHDRDAKVAKSKEFLKSFVSLTLDHDSAQIWGQLSEKLKSNMIEPLDLLIASIAIANRQTLLTRNVSHFERVSGLTVESW